MSFNSDNTSEYLRSVHTAHKDFDLFQKITSLWLKDARVVFMFVFVEIISQTFIGSKGQDPMFYCQEKNKESSWRTDPFTLQL